MDVSIRPRPPVARMSLLLLALIGVCWLAVGLLSRNEKLIGWFQARQVEHWMRTDSLAPQLPFLYRSDRLFFDQIPQTDHSQGGVYFFGASNLATALTAWSLSAQEREFVHNYSVGGISYASMLHLMRYLVDYHPWPAPEGKTLVVFGLFWGNAKRMTWLPHAFPYGMHTYSEEHGLHPSGMLGPLKFLVRERVRSRAFLHTSFNRLTLSDDWSLELRPHRGIPPLTKPKFLRRWKTRMGSEWERDMGTEINALGQAIDLLQEHGARVAIVLLPIGSWARELPYHEPFAEQIAALGADKSVPVTDLTRLLSEDEFIAGDNLHHNYAGTQACQAVLMGIARAHLSQIGALK